jgi:hypothetical protein
MIVVGTAIAQERRRLLEAGPTRDKSPKQNSFAGHES